jgi:hypothetical protein
MLPPRGGESPEPGEARHQYYTMYHANIPPLKPFSYYHDLVCCCKERQLDVFRVSHKKPAFGDTNQSMTTNRNVVTPLHDISSYHHIIYLPFEPSDIKSVATRPITRETRRVQTLQDI